jgi:hypothetical protein
MVDRGVELPLPYRLGVQLADGGRDVSPEDGRARPLRSVSVVDATYLRRVFNAAAMRLLLESATTRRSRRRSRRSAGQTGTRRRAGRPGTETSRPRCRERHGPSAAVEFAPAVLIRPDAPLHHAVDRDVRGGRQLRGRRSLLGRTLLRPMRSVRRSGPIERRPSQRACTHPMTGSHTRRIGSRGHTHQPHSRRTT